MEVTLLRKLTEKSTMGYGKYADMKLYDVMQREPEYLVWSYYNLSNISFTDDVLDSLNIKDRIQKPGKIDGPIANYKLGDWIRSRYDYENKTEEEKKKIRMVISARRKAIYRRNSRERINNIENVSLARLQAVNHGHISSI